MKARYIRVSSQAQSTSRQLARENPGERLFIDKVSGATPFFQRDAGKELIKVIQSNDITYLSVSSVDRLGRNAFDCQSTIQFLNDKGIILKIDNLGIESFINGKQNPIFKMITDVLSNVAQIERESILERQAEGIKLAKGRGIYKGRILGTTISNQQILLKYKNVAKTIKSYPDLSLRKVGAITGVSANTVKKVLEILQDNYISN